LTDRLHVGVVGVPGQWSSEALADALESRTGRRLLVDLGRAVFDSQRGGVFYEDLDLCALDGLVIKKLGHDYSPSMLDRIELLLSVAEAGVTVLSHPASILRLVDRLSGTLTLQRAGIPIPPTVVTEDVGRAAEAVQRFGRALLKPLFSTKARGMRMLVAGPDVDLQAEIRDYKANAGPVLYVQQRVEHRGRDLGVTFLGGRYLGTYARVSATDSWNTTIHAGGSYAAHEPSPAVIEVAQRAQALFDLDFTTVDVAETPEGPMVFEVSAFGGFRGLQRGLGLDAASLLADHVVERIGKSKRLRIVGRGQ